MNALREIAYGSMWKENATLAHLTSQWLLHKHLLLRQIFVVLSRSRSSAKLLEMGVFGTNPPVYPAMESKMAQHATKSVVAGIPEVARR